MIVQRQLPIRVRVHVDEAGSDYAARRVDVPSGFGRRVAFAQDRIDAVTSQQNVAGDGRTTQAVYDEARSK